MAYDVGECLRMLKTIIGSVATGDDIDEFVIGVSRCVGDLRSIDGRSTILNAEVRNLSRTVTRLAQTIADPLGRAVVEEKRAEALVAVARIEARVLLGRGQRPD